MARNSAFTPGLPPPAKNPAHKTPTRLQISADARRGFEQPDSIRCQGVSRRQRERARIGAGARAGQHMTTRC